MVDNLIVHLYHCQHKIKLLYIYGSLHSNQLLATIRKDLEQLTPELRKAATYVLENPNDVGVSSIREIADFARVKPNTFVRMARSFGFSGYEEFRAPFREEIRRGGNSFPERARWLQSLSRGGELGSLYAGMADSAIANIEQSFGNTSANDLKIAADAIVSAGHTYVLGVGINHMLAQSFSYLADMALDNVSGIPRAGSLAVDDLARAGKGDVLLAITFKPYRTDVMAAVEAAIEQHVTVIGISDSPASPLLGVSHHGFVVATDTPQFFTSNIATSALLETLMAFVIADARPEIIENIDRFHARRRRLGIYTRDPDN